MSGYVKRFRTCKLGQCKKDRNKVRRDQHWLLRGELHGDRADGGMPGEMPVALHRRRTRGGGFREGGVAAAGRDGRAARRCKIHSRVHAVKRVKKHTVEKSVHDRWRAALVSGPFAGSARLAALVNRTRPSTATRPHRLIANSYRARIRGKTSESELRHKLSKYEHGLSMSKRKYYIAEPAHTPAQCGPSVCPFPQRHGVFVRRERTSSGFAGTINRIIDHFRAQPGRLTLAARISAFFKGVSDNPDAPLPAALRSSASCSATDAYPLSSVSGAASSSASNITSWPDVPDISDCAHQVEPFFESIHEPEDHVECLSDSEALERDGLFDLDNG